MGLGRDVGGRRPCRPRIAEGGVVEPTGVVVHDDAEGVALAGDEVGGGVHQRPDRRDPAGADDLTAGDEGAEPVGDVDQLRPGQAREQVLVAPREADDLVREDRPDDHRHVTVDHEPVDADGDGLLEATARQAAHVLGRERAQRSEGVVVPPLVIDHVETVDADHGLHRGLGHGGVGAEGHDRL